MAMFIEKRDEKCSECLLCVRDCVMGVWRIVDGKLRHLYSDVCNQCSHCLAICPSDAIVHQGLDASQICHVSKNAFHPEIYRDIVISRRSIRQFKKEPLSRKLIEQIIDLARYAPTASVVLPTEL